MGLVLNFRAARSGGLSPPTFAPKPAIIPLEGSKGSTSKAAPPPWKAPEPPPPTTKPLGKPHKPQSALIRPPKMNQFRRNAPLQPAKQRTQPIANATRERSDRTKRKQAQRRDRTTRKPSEAPATEPQAQRQQANRSLAPRVSLLVCAWPTMVSRRPFIGGAIHTTGGLFNAVESRQKREIGASLVKLYAIKTQASS